ncbi:hypothetical protein FJ364_01090 [Candidatus Dependentiae bacterium]|nr:hypothetical protein [Candidatus Dependentiae bacterium]
MEKRADNNVVIIKQGSVMEHDVEKMLFGAPQYMRATTIEIENKESHPIVVEIDTSNVSIYDTETLAHTLSKEAMECSDKKKLVMGHNFTRGFISSLAVSFALSWPGIANRILHKEALNMPFIRWGYLLLPSIAALGLGYYICKSINASRANILESEEELLFEQHRQMFEHIILSFDDNIL